MVSDGASPGKPAMASCRAMCALVLMIGAVCLCQLAEGLPAEAAESAAQQDPWAALAPNQVLLANASLGQGIEVGLYGPPSWPGLVDPSMSNRQGPLSGALAEGEPITLTLIILATAQQPKIGILSGLVALSYPQDALRLPDTLPPTGAYIPWEEWLAGEDAVVSDTSVLDQERGQWRQLLALDPQALWATHMVLMAPADSGLSAGAVLDASHLALGPSPSETLLMPPNPGAPGTSAPERDELFIGFVCVSPAYGMNEALPGSTGAQQAAQRVRLQIPLVLRSVRPDKPGSFPGEHAELVFRVAVRAQIAGHETEQSPLLRRHDQGRSPRMSLPEPWTASNGPKRSGVGSGAEQRSNGAQTGLEAILRVFLRGKASPNLTSAVEMPSNTPKGVLQIDEPPEGAVVGPVVRIRGKGQPGSLIVAWIEYVTSAPVGSGLEQRNRGPLVRYFSNDTGLFDLHLPLPEKASAQANTRYEIHVRSEAPGYQSPPVVRLIIPRFSASE